MSYPCVIFGKSGGGGIFEGGSSWPRKPHSTYGADAQWHTARFLSFGFVEHATALRLSIGRIVGTSRVGLTLAQTTIFYA